MLGEEQASGMYAAAAVADANRGDSSHGPRSTRLRGAFIGFLVMLAIGAGGSGAARMTLLDSANGSTPPQPPAAAVETPSPPSGAPTLEALPR